MDHFEYLNGELYAENVPLRKIADEVGTPCYVYSRATMERHWHAFNNAFANYPHKIYYAVKANGNLGVLDAFVRLGSGFDIVSIGELHRVLKAGGSAGDVIFSGVGKSEVEIEHTLKAGVFCLNIESFPELKRIEAVAKRLHKKAPIAVRVNPDVDAQTHPYISTALKENKFGVATEDVLDVYRYAHASKYINILGIACHIGSQLTTIEPYVDAMNKIIDLFEALDGEGIKLGHIDFGGGLGIRYKDEQPPLPQDYAQTVVNCIKQRNCKAHIYIAPGRAIMGNAGVLLSRVEYLKEGAEKNFAVVDAAMNDLTRPALYQAFMQIVPVKAPNGAAEKTWDVVGPVCESGDYLGKDRSLSVEQGELIAVRSAGAYGAVMSSNYNTRARSAEVIVDGDDFHIVRAREDIEQMMMGESRLPA
ncbi:MAG: diaminopimelate decarboxylase [Arenicellales bacterium WSBS_2016_MAG_OTU3]